MKFWYKLLLLVLPLSLVFVACEEEDEDSIIAIDLLTDMNGVEMRSGEIFEIKLTAYASDADFKSMRIETFDPQRGPVVLQDSVISSRTYTHNHYYRVPVLENYSTDLRFTFTFTNVNGYSHSIERTVTVVRQEQPLEERTGVILYCDENDGTNPNAYYFAEMRPVMMTLAYEDQLDLLIPVLLDDDVATTIVRDWVTMTDINFARNNSFDYSNATSTSIIAAYDSSVRNPKVTNVQRGDVILVGRGAEALGVIQVLDVFDAGNIKESRFLLNIKAIKDRLVES